jgi:hypothetical protein
MKLASRQPTVGRTANRETIEHFHPAQALLETEPGSAERWRRELGYRGRQL